MGRRLLPLVAVLLAGMTLTAGWWTWRLWTFDHDPHSNYAATFAPPWSPVLFLVAAAATCCAVWLWDRDYRPRRH